MVPRILFLLVAFSASFTLQAQEFSERVHVTAVELIADVTDESGKVPDDLEPKDFIILEEGVERPIIGVERITPEAPPESREASIARQAERRAPWQIVIYFDRALSGFTTLEKSAAALRQQASSLAALGNVEIVVYDGKAAHQMLAPSADVQRIERALDEVAKLRGLDQLAAVRREALQQIRSWDDDRHAQVSRFQLKARAGVTQEANYVTRSRNELATWIGSYALQVPRVLLLVSDGFDLDPTAFYTTDILDPSELNQVQAFMREYDQSKSTDALARALSVGGWTTMPIRYGRASTFTGEAAISGDGKDKDPQTPKRMFVDADGPLKNFAEATGGQVVRDLGKIAEAVSRLQQKVRLTYQVAREADDKVRKVDVRPARRGLKISTFKWVSTSTPESVAGARAVKLLEGGMERSDLPLFARFKRATVRKKDSRSGTLEVRTDLRPMGALRSKLTATTLRFSVAIARKDAPPLVFHEVIRGYNAVERPIVEYSAPIEMSDDATEVALVVEELASGSWGGASFDVGRATSISRPAPLHLAVYDVFSRAEREGKLVIAEFRRACDYCPQEPPDVTAHAASKRALADVLFARRALDAAEAEIYQLTDFPTYAVFDPWKREFARWRGDDNVAEFVAGVTRIVDAAPFIKEAATLRNRGDEARSAIALGVAYRQARWLDKAKEELRKVKALTADRSVIQNAEIHLALTYLGESEFRESIRIARAVADSPENANHEAAAWFVIGQAKRYQEDERGAVEAFSRVAKIAPPDSPLRQQALNALEYFSSNVSPLAGSQQPIRILRPVARVLAGEVKFQTMIRRPEIARVDFLLDGQIATTVYRAPFTAKIDLGKVPREHRIEVVAHSTENRIVGRDAIAINDRHDDFFVKIVEPASDRADGQISLSAEVKVPDDRRLDRVEFLLNDSRIGLLTAPPFVQVAEIQGRMPSVISVVAVLDDGTRAEDVRFFNSDGAGESVEVHLVELYTTVTDEKGAPVRGLVEPDFEVFESGRPQTIERFGETSSDPMTVGLVIDTSESMREEILNLQESAALLLRLALAYEGRAFLVDFDTELRLVQATTSDARALQKSVQQLRPDGGTALYDAIIFGLLQFQGVHGKKALVVLTDGRDTNSRHDFDALSSIVKRTRVPIYFVVLDVTGDIFRGAAEGLRALTIASESGGKAYRLRSSEGLMDVYNEIDADLRSQYLLTYRAPRHDRTGWKDVDVKVKKKGLKARTISGYYGEE